MVVIEDDRRPLQDPANNEYQDPFDIGGEVPSDVMGIRVFEREDLGADPYMIFKDKRGLRGKVRKLVHALHNEGKVIFAKVEHPGKKLAVAVLGASAVAAGMIGGTVWMKVRGKGERKR